MLGRQPIVTRRSRAWSCSLLWLLVALGLSGCHLLRAPSPRIPEQSRGRVPQQLHVDARIRSYVAYVPQTTRPGAPLLMLLHGSRQSAEDLRRATGYAFERIAEEQGFVVVYPEAFGTRWNDCRAAGAYAARAQNVDDVHFLTELIDTLATRVEIDRSRVFIAGYSSGAQLAFRAAIERPERFAAIAAFGANLPTEENWLRACGAASPRIPVLLVNGTGDRINPFAGGRVSVFGFASRGTVRSAWKSAEFFADARAAQRPRPRHEGAADDRWGEWRWARPGAAEVVLLAVRGGGHVVPGPSSSFPRILGKVSRTLDGPRAAWSFFARQPPSAARTCARPDCAGEAPTHPEPQPRARSSAQVPEPATATTDSPWVERAASPRG